MSAAERAPALSTRQRAFTLAAVRALGEAAAVFLRRHPHGDALARRAAALADEAVGAQERTALGRIEPASLRRIDPSWYATPPRSHSDAGAQYLLCAAYAHLVSMDGGALSEREPLALERTIVALGRRRLALAFAGAPRSGLAQLCARLGEPHGSELVAEVRAMQGSPPELVKAAQRAIYGLRALTADGRQLFFHVGAGWLAPVLAGDGDELRRVAQRLPRALGQQLLEEADAPLSDAERQAVLSLLTR